MSTGQPLFWLPKNPNKKLFKLKRRVLFKKGQLASKIALGVLCLSFFTSYQPAFTFPPIKSNIVMAEEGLEQTQQIASSSLPFVFQIPHPGYMSTPFSSYHPGIDIATGLGMPIKSIAPGTVVDEGYNFWGLGLNVVIEHPNGYKSTYAHMGKIYVHKGQQILENDFLGEVGLTGHTTGPHTHLEVTKDGTNINPLSLLPEIRVQPLAEDFIPQNTPPTGGSTTLTIMPSLVTKPQEEIKKEVTLPKLDLASQIRISL